MKLHFVPEPLKYDGTQLRSLWAYRHFGLQGDSLVVFRGPCNIPKDRIVDLEDLRAGSKIAGPDMLHFIVENFDLDLEKSVLRQRLLVAIAREELDRLGGKTIARKGDDLFDGERKLSISIATLSPVSSKIHFAVNVVRSENVGVPTGALGDYKIDPSGFGQAVAARFVEEIAGVHDARTRVRGVE